MTNGNVPEIVDLTDDFSSIIDEYGLDDGAGGPRLHLAVVDLDAWTTTDLVAVRDIFYRAIEIRIEENESIGNC